MLKYLLILNIFILLFSCTSKTIYSGKIINQEELNNINFQNKQILINKFGKPSFIDPIDQNYYYFSEKKIKTSAFNKKTDYSFVFVFNFDEFDNIVETKVFDLKNNEDIKLINEETSNEVIKRGLIEKIFGGVGPQQELTTSP